MNPNFSYEKFQTSGNEDDGHSSQLEEKGQKKKHNLLLTKLTDFLILVDLLNKQGRQINNKDIKDYISSDAEVNKIVQKIEEYKRNHPEKFKDPKNFDLFSIFYHISSWNLLCGFTLSIGVSIAGCLGILILDMITDSLKDYHGESEKKQKICLLFILIILSFVAQSFLSSQYQWVSSKWSAQTRSMLQYLIFSKGLKIPQLTTSSYGEKSENVSQDIIHKSKNEQIPDVHTIIGIDVDKQLQLYWGGTQLISNIIQMVIILFLIHYKIGNAFYEGLKFLMVIFVFNFLATVGWYIFHKNQMKWNDKRVGLSKDVIEGMKSIKYLGWENIFKKKIENLRSKEFFQVKCIQTMNVVQNIFWSCMNYVLLFIFMISYVNQGNELAKSNVFTMIALFGYLTGPFNKLPWAFSYLMESSISYFRIERFLQQSEVEQVNSIQSENLSETIRNEGFNNKNLDPEQIAVWVKNIKFQQHNRQDQANDNNSILSSRVFHLKIENLLIRKGEMMVLIGKIGSGKTALLNAILNELKKVEHNQGNQQQNQSINTNGSHFIVNGSLAYVSQNHWLQHKTIKENILFGEKLDQQWYNTVIEAAQLIQDLNGFKNGDDKIITTGGGNLSGGQKQRIALCRALYSNRDIYLLDDILSSLDAHVADVIFQKAIIELLVRKLKKTVIMTTSHFSIFSQKTTDISQILMIENGKLVQDNKKIDNFIKSGLRDEQDEQQQHHNEIMPQGSSNDKIKFQEDPSQISNKYQDYENNEDKIDEYREKGEIQAQTYVTYFEAMTWILLLAFVICSCFMQISQMTIDFWMRDQIHPQHGIFENINRIYNSFGSTFSLLIAITIGISILKNILYWFCAIISNQKLFLRFHDRLLFSKMKFFDKTASGRIVSRISQDILMLDEMLPYVCNFFLEGLIFSIGYPIGIVIQFPYLLIFIVAALWMIYIVQKLFRISNREVKRLNSVNSGKVMSIIDEACNGVVLIRSFQKEEFILREFVEKFKEGINSSMLISAIQVWMTTRLMLISNIILTCVVVGSVGIILFESQIEFTSISMCLAYSILLSEHFTDLMIFYCQVEQNIISVERLSQYFENEQENLEQKQSEETKNGILETNNGNNDHSQYSIEFENVYITYEDQVDKQLIKTSEKVEFALKDFSLKIRKGEKIAFCGRTGSGKTSILNILFGMYPIQFGSILVHGKNIKQYSLRQLREQMSIIPQFGFLYNDSLLRNLDPEGKIPKSIVETKINATNLVIKNKNRQSNIKPVSKKVEEDEESKSNSSSITPCNDLDLEINNGGGNLSSGERQIVNFLRVILSDTDIVCLDEASSNMDPETDSLLHQQIFKFAQDKTLLVITHRLENINLFDRVVVMEKGRIMECGSIQQLRENKGGFFSKQCQQRQQS